MKNLWPLLGLGLAFVACVGDDPIASSLPSGADAGPDEHTDSGPDSAAPELTLTVAPFEIVRGDSAPFTVRIAGADRDVELAFTTPAGFVVSGNVLVPRGTGEASLTLKAPEDAPLGTASLIAKAGAVSTSGTFTVRGKPGDLDATFGDGTRAELPPGEPYAMAMVGDPAGGFLVAGLSMADSATFAAYDEHGKLARSFATNGVGTCNAPVGLGANSFFGAISLNVLPERYEFAYGFQDGPNFRATRCNVVRPSGAATHTPATSLPLVLGGHGIPQEDGVLWLERRDTPKLRRIGADGSTVADWGASGERSLIPPGVSTENALISADIEALSASHVLVRTRIGYNSGGSWIGTTLVRRDDGSIVSQQINPTGTTQIRAAIAHKQRFVRFFDQNKFFSLSENGGAETQVISDVFVSPGLGDRANVLLIPAGDDLLFVAANGESLQGQAVLMDQTLKARGSATPFALPTVGEGAGDAFLTNGFVDSQRRLVLFIQYDDDASDPTTPNLHWMVRRYWL